MGNHLATTQTTGGLCAWLGLGTHKDWWFSSSQGDSPIEQINLSKRVKGRCTHIHRHCIAALEIIVESIASDPA